MKRTKSIDKLYNEVKEHRKVLTVDAALADALNRRLERPVEGVFASTPKRLAENSEQVDTKKDVFLKAVEETDYSWKQISHSLEKIFESWMHTGEKTKIIEYESYDSELYRDVLELVDTCNTPFHAMEKLELDNDVAVINYFQFNQLDRSVLPDNFTKYDIFSEEDAELQKFNIFKSRLDIMKSLVSNIERIGAENTAIIAKADSQYKNLIDSYFKHSNIDYMRKERVSESENLRIFLALLEAGLTDRKLRIRDLGALVDIFEIENTITENKFIENSDNEIKDFLNIIEYIKFGESLTEFENIVGRDFDEIRELLGDLGLLDENVNVEEVEKLRYYLENFDESLEEKNEGVLLADPENSSVVDRPVVFLLGMTDNWNSRISDDPWVDETWVEEKSLREFEITAQSGNNTVYMVQEIKSNTDLKPSYHIDEIMNKTISSFRELDHVYKDAIIDKNPSKFEKIDIGKKEINFLSQSDLNDLARSPRLFYMSRLVSEIEEESIRKGNLFHEFAELYFNYPEKTEKFMDEIIEIFKDEMRKIVDRDSIIQLETEIKHGLHEICEFLTPDKSYSGRGYIQTESQNFIANELGLEISSTSTEMYFKEKGIKGKIDLISGRNHLIDFKSGKKKSKKEIVKSSRPQTYTDSRYPDFQPLMYIAHHSDYVKGEIKFSFYYFLDGIGRKLSGNDDEESIITVEYTDQKFEDKLKSHELFEYLIKDVKKSNKRRKTLEKLGFSKFRDFLSNKEFPEVYDKDEITEEEILKDFEEMCVEEIGDYKYVKEGAESTFRKIVEYRNTRYFIEDIETIREFIQQKIKEIQRFEEEGYPIGEENLSNIKKEDLII